MIAANVNSEWVFCRTHCRKMTNGCLCKDYVMLPLNRGKFYGKEGDIIRAKKEITAERRYVITFLQ